MLILHDEDEWETVFTSTPCTSCAGDLRRCNGRCNGASGLSQKRRPAEEVKRIKAERRRLHEEAVIAEARAIIARRGEAL